MRASPSGRLSAIENPYPGISSFSSATPVFLGIHSLSGASSEVNGQTIYPKSAKILSLQASVFIAGDDAVNHTWNVRKNGVLIPGMSAVLIGNAIGTITVASSTVDGSLISATDLISLQMVPGTFAGTAPEIRTFLNIGVPR